MNAVEPMFFTREQAAQACGVSVDTIKRAIGRGTLRAKRTGPDGGGRYLISRQAIEDWFEQLEDA